MTRNPFKLNVQLYTTAGGVRRMRFAPTVPVERRAKVRGAGAEGGDAEPQLPQHVQRLIKQAQLEGKVVRPREVVQGLERRAQRVETGSSAQPLIAPVAIKAIPGRGGDKTEGGGGGGWGVAVVVAAGAGAGWFVEAPERSSIAYALLQPGAARRTRPRRRRMGCCRVCIRSCPSPWRCPPALPPGASAAGARRPSRHEAHLGDRPAVVPRPQRRGAPAV